MSTLMVVKVVGLLLAGLVFVVWQLRSVERDLQQSRERRRIDAADSAHATNQGADGPVDTGSR